MKPPGCTRRQYFQARHPLRAESIPVAISYFLSRYGCLTRILELPRGNRVLAGSVDIRWVWFQGGSGAWTHGDPWWPTPRRPFPGKAVRADHGPPATLFVYDCNSTSRYGVEAWSDDRLRRRGARACGSYEVKTESLRVSTPRPIRGETAPLGRFSSRSNFVALQEQGRCNTGGAPRGR